MSHKQRYAARTDENQSAIVSELRSMGISVVVGMDDILCGWRGRTYWYEIKNYNNLFMADGVTFRKGVIKPSQSKIRATYQGHYIIAWSTEMILKDMGIV